MLLLQRPFSIPAAEQTTVLHKRPFPHHISVPDGRFHPKLSCRAAVAANTRSPTFFAQAAVRGILGQQSLAALLPLPAATISLDDTQAAANASRRLQVFGWVSYGLVIVLLAGAGFAELLYIGQDTFRANAWGDYLAVLAWGFGAEVSRTALADLLKGWGVPSFL